MKLIWIFFGFTLAVTNVMVKGQTEVIIDPGTFNDPMELGETSFTIPTELESFISGDAAFCGSQLIGLSAMKLYTNHEGVDPLVLNYYMNATNLEFKGRYDVDITLQETMSVLIPFDESMTFPGKLIGSGDYTLKLLNTAMDLGMTIASTNGQAQVRSVSWDLTFESGSFNTTGTTLNGEHEDWQDFSAALKDMFDTLWAIAKPVAEAALLEQLNLVLECTMEEMETNPAACFSDVRTHMKIMQSKMTSMTKVSTRATCSDSSVFGISSILIVMSTLFHFLTKK